MQIKRFVFFYLCVFISFPAYAASENALAAPSSSAQKLYSQAKHDLLQLRILLKNGRSQSTTGSGFVMGTSQWVVTNYHVISKIALEPETYLGEYLDTQGRKGPIELIAVDVLRDLAVVRIDRSGTGFFKLPENITALEQGENLYSLGNPLDLGFAISEGTYNGISSRGFSDQLMFTGALNPGMSGGPNITVNGDIAGVNVSHRLDGELVSFLVPARYVQQLLAAAEAQQTPPDDFKPVIAAQLLEYQQVMMDHFLNEPLTHKALGHYQIPVRESEQIRCWGNSESNPKDTYTTDTIYCGMESAIYISGELQTGSLSFEHKFMRSKAKNPLRFSRLVSNSFAGQIWSSHKGEELTGQECTEEFIANQSLSMRAVLCVTAYRKFSGLYNFSLLTVSTDENLMSLKSHYNIQGVSYENGLTIARLFLESIVKRQPDEQAEVDASEPEPNGSRQEEQAP